MITNLNNIPTPVTSDAWVQRPGEGSYHQELRQRETMKELERKLVYARDALAQIRANPGWQDNEVGYMSGHIAAGALNVTKM